MTKKRILKIALIAAAAVLIVLLIWYRETVRMVFCNATSPKIQMDTTENWDGGASYEKLQYSDISGSDYMNLYVPDSAEPMPLFVLVHGGGFVYNDCESRQAQFMYRYFRDHGYACASVNYRLAQEAGFPAALEDVKAAVRFLRANADEYGYDPDQIAVWGESAGGYLTMMAAATDDSEFMGVPFIGEEELAEPVSARVQALVDFYGAAEMGENDRQFAEMGIPRIVRWACGLWLKDAVKDYPEYDNVKDFWVRGKISEMSEEEKQVFDPYYYIRKNLGLDSGLDVLIWHGDADLDVPLVQSEHLNSLLAETIGAEHVRFEVFHNYKHAADRFYSDDSLARVKEFLDQVFGVTAI